MCMMELLTPIEEHMINDIDKLYNHLCKEISRRCDIAVVGLSGGIDSAVVAKVCYDALSASNVYVVHMRGLDSNVANTQQDRASTFANIVLTKAHVYNMPLSDPIKSIKGVFFRANIDITPLMVGNASSRIRMIILYGLANALEPQTSKKVRVVGTSNLSELYVGYITKYGDGGADFEPIGDLYKSEVYQLARWLRDRSERLDKEAWNPIIDAAPTAGLWDGQTDEGELGFTYDQIEQVMRKDYQRPPSKPHQNIIDKHMATEHKRIMPPAIELRYLCNDGGTKCI